VDGWLSSARDRLAQATGEDASALELSDADSQELLELARVAAHESGERTNAPLLCYLAGLAHGRRGGDLADIVDSVVGKRS
jgi:hypothetical protein